jgi:two-component system, OmpR family, phosphate regulon response regulator PhoB
MEGRYILIVEDERPIREMMSFTLRRAEFESAEAADAEAARLSIAQRRPDLLLVDWVLPKMSGLDFVKLIRQTRLTQSIPIIMVTARAAERDRVIGLDCGADDYLTKPFAPRELLSRIQAVLRRSRAETPREQIVEASGLVLDAGRQALNAGPHTIPLSPTDFRLLEFFMSHPERVHDRTELLNHVWGGRAHAEERTVDVQIRRLRKALEPCSYDRFIQTVRGTGYRFSTRVD